MARAALPNFDFNVYSCCLRHHLDYCQALGRFCDSPAFPSPSGEYLLTVGSIPTMVRPSQVGLARERYRPAVLRGGLRRYFCWLETSSQTLVPALCAHDAISLFWIQLLRSSATTATAGTTKIVNLSSSLRFAYLRVRTNSGSVEYANFRPWTLGSLSVFHLFHHQPPLS